MTPLTKNKCELILAAFAKFVSHAMLLARGQGEASKQMCIDMSGRLMAAAGIGPHNGWLFDRDAAKSLFRACGLEVAKLMGGEQDAHAV